MKKNNVFLLACFLLMLILVSCAKKDSPPIPETTLAVVESIPQETAVETTVQESSIPVETTQKVLTDEQLITNALLKHYDPQFGNTNNPIKSTGFKIYKIDDSKPGEKTAYGFATYHEYSIDGDKVKYECGSGPTGISITFLTDGTDSKVNYEVLTDKDMKSAEFKNAFPQDVQEKIIARKQEDIDEVYAMQKNMVKKIYQEKTGKELTTKIE